MAAVERRYQVFVSSTFLDLKEERSAVVSALLQLEAFPAGMELFPAVDDDAWTLISRVVDESDYYLLVIGGKYGSVDPESRLSYTEKEFDLAVARKKPVMAFLHGDVGAIPMSKSEPSPKAREALEAFREKVKATRHVKYWSSPEDLAGKVALSFASVRQMYPAVGWVRGDAQTSTESLVELNELRKQLEDAQRRLSAARSGPPSEAKHLEQGEDPVDFVAASKARVRTAFAAYGQEYTGKTPIDASWDEVFAALGPELLDEAEQRAMRRLVDAWITQRFGPSFRRSVRRQLEGEGETVEGFSNTKLELGSDDFGTLIIQFRALGLLEKSTKKRSVSDRGAYWTLTEYGDTHLTTLRARSRKRQPDSPEDEDEEEG